MLVRLTDFERRSDGVVLYVIQVEHDSWGLVEMWEVRRRFSEFRKLHLELGDTRPFPSRLVVCRSPGWKTTRMEQLEDWLCGTVETIPGWKPLIEFLCIPMQNSPKSGGLHQLLTHFRKRSQHQLLAHFRKRSRPGIRAALFDRVRALGASRVEVGEEEDEAESTLQDEYEQDWTLGMYSSHQSDEPLQYTTW
jgi:hypothetical protein